MAAAEGRGKEENPPPTIPAMRAYQAEGVEARRTEKGGEPSVWHSNPLGLAETLKRRAEMKKMADSSHQVALERRGLEHPHIEVQARLEADKVCIKVPKEILDRNSFLWKYALVGRFTGPRPDLERIRQWAALRWRVMGLEITALPKGSILFNFPNQEDMLRVLLKAPWYMEGKGLLLEKWHEGYNPTNTTAQMIPLWVNIPNLPLQSWDEDVIRSIANAIGKLIAIDSATSNRTRLIQARFCVLIRTDKAIPTEIELEMQGQKWSQELVFEASNIRCFKCKGGGHLPQNCNQEEEDQDKQEPEDKEKEQVKEDEEILGEEQEGTHEDPGPEGQQIEESKEDEGTGEHQAKETIQPSNEVKEDGQHSKEDRTEQEGPEQHQEKTKQEEQDQEQEQEKEKTRKARGTNRRSHTTRGCSA